MKVGKELRHLWDEVGVGAYCVNLARAHEGKKALPLWWAALMALWHDAAAFLEVRVLS